MRPFLVKVSLLSGVSTVKCTWLICLSAWREEVVFIGRLGCAVGKLTMEMSKGMGHLSELLFF